MPSTSLTDLPPELLIHILKSSDSFADVTSLSSISRKMFIVWKTNIDVISNAILARNVLCFDQARELIDAQEKVEGDEHSVFGYQSPIDRVQWMLKEADIAAKAFVYFESHVRVRITRFSSSAYDQAPVERKKLETDFHKAYYRATTLATLGKDSVPLRLLLSWDLLDCEWVKDVNIWVLDFCGAVRRPELGIWCEYDYRNAVPIGITRNESWVEIFDFLSPLTLALYKVTLKPDQEPGNERPFYPFMARSPYPVETATNRGALLADLLPLVCETDTRFHIGHKLSEAVLQIGPPPRQKS